MLTCKELVQLVTEYLENALSPEDRLRFEQHVMICPPCRAYLAQMRGTLRIAGTLSEEDVSPDAERTLVEAFRSWQRDREA
jgi:hypothetical protein